MKINKIEKIDEHFNEIKTESIFAALKEKKYIGFTRSEISRLLEKHNIDQVFAKLKTPRECSKRLCDAPVNT